jgi:hypothetical protein
MTSAVQDRYTLASWNRAYDEAMQWRDWQTCEQMLKERESESWWPAERARVEALPDPPGAGWSE